MTLMCVCWPAGMCRKYRHDDLPPGTEPAEGELHWTKRTTILYPLLCSTAGLIAGLFGIGGGEAQHGIATAQHGTAWC